MNLELVSKGRPAAQQALGELQIKKYPIAQKAGEASKAEGAEDEEYNHHLPSEN